jgi:hypothetical protein
VGQAGSYSQEELGEVGWKLAQRFRFSLFNQNIHGSLGARHIEIGTSIGQPIIKRKE